MRGPHDAASGLPAAARCLKGNASRTQPIPDHTFETLAEVLAAAWAHALPGKESVERDSVSALDRFADLSRTSPEVREVLIGRVRINAQLRRSFESIDINASAAAYGRSPMFVIQALYT